MGIRKALGRSARRNPRHAVSEQVARFHAPMWIGPFVRLAWRMFGGRVVLLLGLTVQVLLMWVLGELLDTFAGLAELWDRLARENLGGWP